MAWGYTNRGGGNRTAGATSVVMSPTVNFTVAADRGTGLLVVAYDNSGAGGTDPYSSGASVTDSVGNVWTMAHNRLRSAANAVNDGVVLRLFVCQKMQNAVTTTTTVTINFGAVSVPAVSWGFYQLTASAGNYGRLVEANSAGGTGTTPTITTTSTIPDVTGIVVGILAVEANTNGADDADALNGTWSVGSTQIANTGTTATSIAVRVQQKTQTTTPSTQTYNPTSPNSDRIVAYAYFIDEPAAVSASAGLAAGTGAAQAPKATVAPNAADAAGIGSTPPAVSSVAPNAEAAAGVGSAWLAAAKIDANAGLASGVGQARAPSASGVSGITADAGLAAGTGAARSPAAAVAPNAEAAAGSGAARAPTALGVGITNAPAGTAAGTGDARTPSVAVSHPAGLAPGVGAARDPKSSVAPNAGGAAGTGVARPPGVLAVPNVSAPAGLAAGTGAARSPSVWIRAAAENATAVGQALPATVTAVKVPIGGLGRAHLQASGQRARLTGDSPVIAAWYWETPGDTEHWNDDNLAGHYALAQSFDLGDGALKVTQTSPADVAYPYSPYQFPTARAYPGVVHTVRFRIWTAVALRHARLGLVWLTSPNVESSRVYGADVDLVAGAWNEVTFAALAPPGTVFVCAQTLYMTQFDTPVPNGESAYLGAVEVSIPTAPTGAVLLDDPEPTRARLVESGTAAHLI